MHLEVSLYSNPPVPKPFSRRCNAHTLLGVERMPRLSLSLSSQSFSVKGWYPHEKHSPALHFSFPLECIKTRIEDASEALDSWTFPYRSLIELGLPEGGSTPSFQ
jgi:hypothetical protein